MNRLPLGGAIRLLWSAVAVGLIGTLMSAPGGEGRLWLMTVLVWLAAPSSFATVPVANWLVARLDMVNTRSIDLFVSSAIVLIGYVQWFALPAFIRRAGWRRESASGPGTDRGAQGVNETLGRPEGIDQSVVVFYGDDPECLSLTLLLGGSGIQASTRNYSMEGAGMGRTDVRVSVRRADLERARPLVEHFQEQLRNSPGR
jgi:hypothetical protein